MNMTIMPMLVLAAMFIYITGVCIYQYNQLVKLRKQAHESWTKINEALQQRQTLAAKMNDIIQRAAPGSGDRLFVKTDNLTSGSPYKRLDANRYMTKQLEAVYTFCESDPKFAAKKNMYETYLDIKTRLAEADIIIRRERDACNSVISRYNELRNLYPTAIIARLAKFDYEPPLNAEPETLKPETVPNREK